MLPEEHQLCECIGAVDGVSLSCEVEFEAAAAEEGGAYCGGTFWYAVSEDCVDGSCFAAGVPER